MYPDDLVARVHKAAVAAQRFLLTAGPCVEASPAEIDTLCASLREANLPALCLESIVHRVLRSVRRTTQTPPAADPGTHWEAESLFTDPIERFRDYLLQLVHLRVNTPERVREALAVIARRATEPDLTLSDVATEVNLSPRHLSHLLKAATGLGFRRHLRSSRLARAAELFTERACRVKEAWTAVGYRHASEFGRHFKAHYGLTPGEYRNLMGDHAGAAPSPPTLHIRADPAGCATDTARAASARHATPACSASRRLVLIVDDDPSTTEGLGRLMRHAGYDTVTAHDLGGALAAAADRKPDAAIVDYRLPGLNGVECMRVLTSRRGWQRTRFFILTGDCSALDHADELSARNGSIVFKPLDPHDLIVLLNRALDAA